jgi:arylformamidase
MMRTYVAMRTLWDISPPVHAGAPVFPGDTAYEQTWAARIGPGCPVNVSTLTTVAACGRPRRRAAALRPDGAAIGALDLDALLGRCRVIHAIGCGPLVLWEHLAHAMAGPAAARAGAHLRRMPVDRWDDDLPAFAPETVARWPTWACC